MMKQPPKTKGGDWLHIECNWTTSHREDGLSHISIKEPPLTERMDVSYTTV